MDFDLSAEQEQLRELVQRYVRQDYSFEARRAIVASPEGFSRETWAAFAGLGLLGIGIPEAYGGLDGGGVDTFVVMEALGTGLVVEPYLETVVLGAGIVRDAGTEAQRAAILPAVAVGELFLALAHEEPGGRYELDRVATTARSTGEGFVLQGSKSVVMQGGAADRLIVSARIAGAGEGAVSLFLVDATGPGVSRRSYPTRDSRRAAEVTLEGVTLPADALLGAPGEGVAILERGIDAALAALCAEAVGCMDALNAQTLEYLKTRKQFGVAIGTFQAVKHRMADMFIAAAQSRSMACLAAMRASHPDRAARRAAVSAAKAFVGKSARFVGQQALQLHGGMGVTDELMVSHGLRRLMAINATFGDAEHHLACYSDAMAVPARAVPATLSPAAAG